MSLKNTLLTATGFLLLGVGAVGVIVPVLPTTPFVIAASVCFAGNPRLRAWLMKSKFFAEHINNYKQRTGLCTRTVALSLGFLWAMLVTSILAVGELWLTLLLFGIGIAVSTHILWIAQPKKKDSIENKTKENTYD